MFSLCLGEGVDLRGDITSLFWLVGFSESIHFKLGPDCSENSLQRNKTTSWVLFTENKIPGLTEMKQNKKKCLKLWCLYKTKLTAYVTYNS